MYCRVEYAYTYRTIHAMILSHHDTIYIDPYGRNDTTYYISYFKRNARSEAAAEFIKYPPIDPKSRMKKEIAGIITAGEFARSGPQLRTYRLAVAATGEYTQNHGGTVALGLAAIVTAINRVTGVYEVELAVRLQLVANNNLLVYTNSATDPYSNAVSIMTRFHLV